MQVLDVVGALDPREAKMGSGGNESFEWMDR
jgi:hypothetical protein